MSHSAVVQTRSLPPPADPIVRHSSRLWVVLEPGILGGACVTPEGQRSLCFDELESAFDSALHRALWSSFPRVERLDWNADPQPSDYVLKLDVRLKAEPPSVRGPGWAATAEGHWQIERDGIPILGEQVKSTSRSDFAYGRPLGVAAGEVVDAIAQHIGTRLSALPEQKPEEPRALPSVQAHRIDARGTQIAER